MRALVTLGLALALAVPVSAQSNPAWTVAQRRAIPLSGQPVDLAPYMSSDEDTMRIELTGTVSFLLDGSELDAVSATVNGQRDVTAGPFVVLPPGSRFLASAPELHSYTIEVPRSHNMLISFNAMGLAMRHLVTASEVRGNLTGSIEVAHLVPPPPPPSDAVVAGQTVVETATGVPWWAWVSAAFFAVLLAVVSLRVARRRREGVAVLLRRARRAHGMISSEVVSLGPAFDPVAASAGRLLEAAQQHASHTRSLEAALERTAKLSSSEAERQRVDLYARKGEVLAKLEDLASRLEATATELAGRAADSARASGVESLLAELGSDLDAATSAEDELAAL